MDEGTNQFTSRALCSRIELDLWKVSQNTEYLCLFALQDNLLLALKEFKKREGEKSTNCKSAFALVSLTTDCKCNPF